MAAYSGQREAVDVLLAWGADGTVKDTVSSSAEINFSQFCNRDSKLRHLFGVRMYSMGRLRLIWLSSMAIRRLLRSYDYE